MKTGRLNIAACSIGGVQLSLDTAQQYVQNRVQFEQPIAYFQNTAVKLAAMLQTLPETRHSRFCVNADCRLKTLGTKRTVPRVQTHLIV